MAKSKKLDVLKKGKFSRIKLIGDITSDFSKNNVLMSKVELNFNKEAIVEDCRGVNDYSDKRIVLNVRGGFLIFEGDGLTLHSYESSTAIIKGNFSNIGYEL